MSYEVEMKFRSADHEELRRRLAARGVVEGPTVVEVDTYLSHPSRDFARSGEALRIRRIGAENRITYKGPRHEGPTKTREEIEVPFDAGEDAFGQLARLFENLGFRPIATIRKARTTFHLPDPDRHIEVLLDRADGLGDFVEIEIVAGSESEVPAAQAAVLDLAGPLGLTEVEPRSYLRMFLESRRQTTVTGASSIGPGPGPDPAQTG